MIRDWPDDDPDVIRKVAVGPDPLEPCQHRRKIWMAFERRHTTRTLAVAKQVCGGLFAKAMPSWAPVEDRAVYLLVQAATDYDACLNMMSTASLRTRLHNAAAKITSALRNDLSDTVDRQLCLISTLLCDESTRLEWSPFLNNCQKFCNKLLGPEFLPLSTLPPIGTRSTRISCAQPYSSTLLAFIRRPVNVSAAARRCRRWVAPTPLRFGGLHVVASPR